MSGELEPTEDFWTIDEELCELELKERPGGPDIYSVRFKGHTSSSPYDRARVIYPLAHDGIQTEVFGKAYILVPDITLTVGLFERSTPSGAVGAVRETTWQGMRHHEIASARGLYYDRDRAIGLWEVDSWGRLDRATQTQLWRAFERFLIGRFPGATRIFTDDAQPFEGPEHNRELLGSLGYTHVARTHRIFSKEVREE
jgi:hypothetical protein